MSSRKEQKEQLRREREERAAAAQSDKRRKQMVGYGVGSGVVVALVALAVALLGGGGGDSKKSGGGGVLPDGGSVPKQKVRDLDAAAKAAGCTLTSYKGKSREHIADPNQKVTYDSKPPTEGKHYQVPADDGAYGAAPKITATVHALEHGRIVIWFKKSLPKKERANLKALFDEDSYQMLLMPDTTGMKYQVAASAWSRDPVPNGTGRLLGCDRFDDGVYDAIRTFKDEHRSDGPEAIP